MTRSFLTVRMGATVTHVHCRDIAAMWVTHLIDATQYHADVQGPISSQAPGDKRDDRAHPHDVHGLTTSSISGATTGSSRTSLTPSHLRGTTSGSSPASTDLHADEQGPISSQAPGDVHGRSRTMRAIPCVGKVFTDEMHHQRSDNAVPGDNAGLNIKALDTCDMPRSSDVTGYKKDTAAGQTKYVSSSSSPPLQKRLATVEASLRLQDATGASHLQQLEIDPEAYGLATTSRSHIKRLRLQRNRALHGATTRTATKPRQLETVFSKLSVAPKEEAVLSTPSPATPAPKPEDEETVLLTPSSARPVTPPIQKKREEETMPSTPSVAAPTTQPKEEATPVTPPRNKVNEEEPLHVLFARMTRAEREEWCRRHPS